MIEALGCDRCEYEEIRFCKEPCKTCLDAYNNKDNFRLKMSLRIRGEEVPRGGWQNQPDLKVRKV